MSAEQGSTEQFFEKQRTDFLHGLTDSWQSHLPGADIGPQGQWIRMGREHRGQGSSGRQPPPPQTLGEAIAVLGGLAGLAGGVFAGLVVAGSSGWNPLLALVLFAAFGLVAGIVGVMFIQGWLRRIAEGRLWRRGREKRTAEILADRWGDRFGTGILQALVRRVDEDGSAWIMDRRGNFILRMGDGSEFFVGSEKVGERVSEVVQKRGGRVSPADAINMALMHHSLGKTSISLVAGTRKAKGVMWAGAKLTGLEVTGYRPDTAALEMLDEMRRDFAANA